MSMTDSRPKTLGLALLLALASMLTGCSNGLQDRNVAMSDQQQHELRDRALYQSDR